MYYGQASRGLMDLSKDPATKVINTGNVSPAQEVSGLHNLPGQIHFKGDLSLSVGILF